MQAAKNAAASVKETAENIGASAKSGMDKTKAVIHGKTEKMTTGDPVQKQMAEDRKQEKITEAELRKREAREQNAAAKESARATHNMGGPTSVLHGHGTGQPGHGQVTSGVIESHPIGTTNANAGTGTTTARNPLTGTGRTEYGTGGGL